MHVAIIPDGNRRWARARAWHPWQGHEKAVENFRTITDWCEADPRIGVLTVWCFSTENWKRDPKEVAKLMTIFEDYLQKERPTFQQKRTRLLHSGRKDRIPASLAALIADVEAETAHFSEFTLHLGIDYGGKDEVLRAISKAASPVQSEEKFRALLDHPELPDIDLVIRTSGEQRTSNFFLWQSAYAEWIFLDKLFPDFTTDDLKEAVDGFAKRSRRFGS
ncbi:di-trans,poly-cis-decaprenylcistransferase [Candidatus Peribacteria bacterium RIFOXYC1_FULL_58_8]|nr:MAG: di-trans,poly-cis-decaprenylcistransferase [Candidatus Peribacteria bacterium RIFOXYC1_FULL_58_8]OGJ78989.1 MAG: di-trans,poly-cis-decaprenylcistransferase [Candidatus Peribacteria bacterium RIFOXYB1_FULL_57_12]